MPGKRRAESEERRAESGEQKETAHESHQSTRMGAGNDMVRDAAERDARQGERHALRSAGIRGNSALERSQPARLSRTTDGRGDGGSPRAWRRRPRRQPRNPSDRPDCTLLRNHRATGPAVPVCGGASLRSPRRGRGAEPRLSLYRRSESASHIGAPSGLAPGGHVSLSDTAGGASGPAGGLARL
jgi:hypothetical protein